jgi:RNA methyltransferase, TrmH family
MTEPALTSRRNPRVRAAAALRDRRARDAAGMTLIDGARELARAVDGGADVSEVFVDRTRLGAEGHAAVDRARARGAAVTDVGGSVLDLLAYGDRTQGLVAVARIPDTSLVALELPAEPLVVVLEGVEKPGNLGAVLRSADGAGADAVVLADPRTDPFNPNAIRASQGTVFAVPVAAGSAEDVLAWLRGHDLRILAARTDGALDVADADLLGPLALVFGSEVTGLTDRWSGTGVEAIRLPMLGVADSLNVSITAAVLLYEARRQRGG